MHHHAAALAVQRLGRGGKGRGGGEEERGGKGRGGEGTAHPWPHLLATPTDDDRCSRLQ